MQNIEWMVSYSGSSWVSTKAKSLAAAKRAASALCPFQGQTLWVGCKTPSGLVQEAAVRRCDPMTQLQSPWVNL
jgi:hypothetical protein